MSGPITRGSLLLALALCACAHPENYRWGSLEGSAIPPPASTPADSQFEWVHPSVAVYSYALAPAATPAPAAELGLKDLSDHAQAALVEAMTRSGADPAKVLAGVLKASGGGADKPPPAAVVDESYSRAIVATVTKGIDAGPGDRLVWTWIDIRPLNFFFDGYSVIATDNEVLNVEQTQHQLTAQIQGQAGKTASDTTAVTTATPPVTRALTDVLGTSLGASGSLSAQSQTTATVSQQFEKLGADIIPTELRIYRESERNLDVAGNTVISLTMRVDPATWHDPAREVVVQRVAKQVMIGADGHFVAPPDLSLTAGLEKAPPHCDLIADVTLVYELRQVIGNARSYAEGEQRVRYVQRTVTQSAATIVPANEVRKPSWGVYFLNAQRNPQAVGLIDPYGQAASLDFTSYEQARAFAAWMNANLAALRADPLHKVGKSGELDVGGPTAGFPVGFSAMRRTDVETGCAGMNRPAMPTGTQATLQPH